jgi:hypothetical protein
MFLARCSRIGSADRGYNDGVELLQPNIQQRSCWLPFRWRMEFRCRVCNRRSIFWNVRRCCFDFAILNRYRSHWATRFKFNQSECRITKRSHRDTPFCFVRPATCSSMKLCPKNPPLLCGLYAVRFVFLVVTNRYAVERNAER